MRAFWLLTAAGAALRIAVAFTTVGNQFDVGSFMLVRDALESDFLHAYTVANEPILRWPYPGGFMPWLYVSGHLADATGLRFDGFVQLAPIAADAAIGWVVFRYLGARGMDDRRRLSAVALIAFGPAFAVISGYAVQIDSVAILPALLALIVWERAGPRRALAAGVLIGLGGAVKGVPLLMILALAPTARSWREAAVLVTAAVGVVVASVAPFLAVDLDSTVAAMRQNRGVPGLGGISLLVQPGVARGWLLTGTPAPTAATLRLFDLSGFAAIGALAFTGALLMRRRAAPLDAAAAVWLTTLFLGVNFAFQYVIWLLPFLLLAGRLRTVVFLQAVLLVPMALIYTPWRRDLPLELIYVPFMLAFWVVTGLMWVLALRGRSASYANRAPAPH